MNSKTTALRLLAAVGVAGVLVVGGTFAAWSGDDARTTDKPEQVAASQQATTPSAEPTPQVDRNAKTEADAKAAAQAKAKAKANAAAKAKVAAKAADAAASDLAEVAEQQVDKRAKARQAKATALRAAAAQPVNFRLMTFNILGSQHSAPGGVNDHYAPGRARSEWAANVIAGHNADIVGFQEIQRDQLAAVTAATSRQFDSYPGVELGGKGVPQTLMWRTAVWQSVSKNYFNIPFTEQVRPQPYVRLKHRATGREIYVINMHTSAKTVQMPREADRDKATAQVITLIKKLRADSGLPVYLIGDLNEHEEVFCKITGQTDLRAASGGSNSGGSCRPPSGMRVDWIFGSGSSFSNYVQDRSPMVARTTDHAVLATTVTVS